MNHSRTRQIIGSLNTIYFIAGLITGLVIGLVVINENRLIFDGSMSSQSSSYMSYSSISSLYGSRSSHMNGINNGASAAGRSGGMNADYKDEENLTNDDENDNEENMDSDDDDNNLYDMAIANSISETVEKDLNMIMNASFVNLKDKIEKRFSDVKSTWATHLDYYQAYINNKRGNNPGFVKKKYFFYQPSGGWGNQRYDIRWAMVAANAMNRSLILPPIAPHSSMYTGYNRFLATDLVPMDFVLDMESLNRSVRHGVSVHNDTTASLRDKYMPKLTWKVYRKPSGWWSFQTIQKRWLNEPADIVFWEKSSMWMCCGTRKQMKEWYSRNIRFSDHIKSLAKILMAPFGKYNAVHVRRGDHVQSDRETADIFYSRHYLSRMNASLPIYIATDEIDESFFNSWKAKFPQLIFRRNLDQYLLKRTMRLFPEKARLDIAGFIEILICGGAVKWEGSRGSTFSASIAAARVYPELRNIHNRLIPRPRSRDWLIS